MDQRIPGSDANSVFIDFFTKTFTEQKIKSLQMELTKLAKKDPDSAFWVQAFLDNLERIRGRNIILQKEYRYINYLQAVLDFFATKFSSNGLEVPAVLSDLQQELKQMRPKIVAIVGEDVLHAAADTVRALHIPEPLERHIAVLQSEIKHAGFLTNTSLKRKKIGYLQALAACYQLQGGYTLNDIESIAIKAQKSDPEGYLRDVEEGRTAKVLESLSGPFADGMRDEGIEDDSNAKPRLEK